MEKIERRWYWERFTDGEGSWTTSSRRAGPPGEDLAALRSGAGRLPGTVPALWRFHVVEVPDERLRAFTDSWEPPLVLSAEHHALVLYGNHQQSKSHPMHRRGEGFGLGEAVRTLHATNRYTADAVDRRFYASVTSSSLDELVVHLRGLVSQMRSLQVPQPLDYTQLVEDLHGWNFPSRRDRIRRRWGLQYHAFKKKSDKSEQKATGMAAGPTA